MSELSYNVAQQIYDRLKEEGLNTEYVKIDSGPFGDSGSFQVVHKNCIAANAHKRYYTDPYCHLIPLVAETDEELFEILYLALKLEMKRNRSWDSKGIEFPFPH